MSRWGKVAIAVLVLAVWFGAGLGPLLRPLLYTLTPLQRYYLGAYMASSWKAGRAGATTEVRWVFKTKLADTQPKPKPSGKHKAGSKPTPQIVPELAYFFAEERDMIAMPVLDTVWNGGALPFLLSADAEREGWTGLKQSYPRTMASGKMAAFLREEYFDGASWWRYFVQPASTLAMLALLILLIRQVRGDLRERYRRGWPHRRYEFRREMLWRWMLESRETPPRLPSERAAPLQIEATVGLAPRKSVSPQDPSAPARTIPQPEPAPPSMAAPQAKAAFVWDESKGID